MKNSYSFLMSLGLIMCIGANQLVAMKRGRQEADESALVTLNQAVYNKVPKLYEEFGANDAMDCDDYFHGQKVEKVAQNDVMEIDVFLDEQGVTPLHAACLGKSLYVVINLIEHGADVNARTASGATPLHFARFAGALSIAQWLLYRGADAGAADKNGLKPHDYAQ